MEERENQVNRRLAEILGRYFHIATLGLLPQDLFTRGWSLESREPTENEEFFGYPMGRRSKRLDWLRRGR